VVTKCCEVKTVEAKATKEAGAAVATKGSAAVSGSGQAAATKQTITQTNTQSVGDITGNDNIIGLPDETGTVVRQPIGGGQVNEALNVNVPVNVQITGVTLNPAVAWNGGQANTGAGDVTSTELAVLLAPP
jgi:hypothetical protein